MKTAVAAEVDPDRQHAVAWRGGMPDVVQLSTPQEPSSDSEEESDEDECDEEPELPRPELKRRKTSFIHNPILRKPLFRRT